MKTAMISPAKDCYSETFIQAQKKCLEQVLFYFGGEIPSALEGKGKLVRKPLVYWFKLKRLLKLTRFSDAEQGFERSLVANKIEVVFAHYGPTGSKILNVCRKLNLPLIVHFHGYDISRYDILAKYKVLYEELFIDAFKVIAVSQEMINDLINLGCPEEKIVYSPCSPDDDFYTITPDYKNLNVLSVGRFTEKKAPKITIRAFFEVSKHLPDAKLFMVGDGDQKQECVDLVNELELQENVSFLGALNKIEIIQLMKQSRAFMQHSVVAASGDKEGTPVAVMEASLAGIPVIASRHAGIKDVIIHEETGLLCDEYDFDVYSNNLLRVLKNIELASRIGNAGKIRIKEKYNRDKQIERLQELIYLAGSNNLF
jgi:glycosyltransferase involved in cell wall biosynthesis